MGLDFTRVVLWMLLLPMLGALLNLIAWRGAPRRLVEAIGVGCVALSFGLAVLAAMVLANREQALVFAGWRWLPLRLANLDASLAWRLVFDRLSAVMCLIITGIGTLIHLYAVGYMRQEASVARFFACMNAFVAAMLLLVLASSLPLMFIGWEGVGLCSYLLIGFWQTRLEFVAAAKKAFLLNRIGDIGLLLAMLVLARTAHSLEFDAIAAAVPELALPFFIGDWQVGATSTVACLLLLWGCVGKSAQIPLHGWLPDAMVGPTPVSALIHAATMVTAGVYLICRLSPLFFASQAAMQTVALLGAATALLGAVLACSQTGLKRVLAYSTMSQLGIMFVGLGCGAFGASLLHLLTHAFFKACLFLAAGAIMLVVQAHDDVDLRHLDGLRRRTPLTHAAFLVAALALAGVPGTSGFFSKDAILAAALASTGSVVWWGKGLFTVLWLTSVLTAFYIFRAYFVAFGKPSSAAPSASEAAIVLPRGMRVALVGTGVGALASGWLVGEAIGLPWNGWKAWLAPWATASWAAAAGGSSAGEGLAAGAVHLKALLGGAAACGVGIVLAYVGSRQPTPFARSSALRPWLSRCGLDACLQRCVVQPARWLATVILGIDHAFVGALSWRLPTTVVRLSASCAARLQSGSLHAYAATMGAGMLVALAWILYPHASITSRLQRNTVTLQAGRGLGYLYRWDLNGDGVFDTGAASAAGHQVEVPAGARSVLEVRNAFGQVATQSIDTSPALTLGSVR